MAIWIFFASVTCSAQSAPAVEDLARRVTEIVAKSQGLRVLIVPSTTCLLDASRCAEFDSAVRSALEKAVPGVRLLDSEDLVPVLKARGLLEIDAYFPEAAEMAAAQTGATILVTESLTRTDRNYDLTAEVHGVTKNTTLGTLSSNDPRPLSTADGEPLLRKDPEKDAWLVIERNEKRSYPGSRMPECGRCPNPQVSTEMRRQKLPWQGKVVLAVTVTPDGRLTDMSALRSFTPGSASYTAKAIEGWQFKPAIGPDGKPFPARIRIEINYRAFR